MPKPRKTSARRALSFKMSPIVISFVIVFFLAIFFSFYGEILAQTFTTCQISSGKNFSKPLDFGIYFIEVVMENIGKEVFASNSGKRVGYILDVMIDFQAFSQIGYVVVDEENETEFCLKKSDIKNLGDCVLIEDESVLKYLEEKYEGLLGKRVIESRGQNLGVVNGFVCERGKLKRLTTDKCEIETRFVKLVGEDSILVSFRREKRKKNFVMNQTSDESVIKISNAQKIAAPEKISLAFNFYFGKVSKTDIFGYNNERIVAKGSVISRAIFENVKKHNKLNELFFAIQ